MTIRHLHMGCGEALLSPLFATRVKPVEQRLRQHRKKQKPGKQKETKGY